MASENTTRTLMLAEILDKTSQPSFDELGDAITCTICHEPYLKGGRPELPLKLSCGHITGSNCLLRWMKPLSTSSGSNTCPMCRSPILEIEQHGNNGDSMDERIQRLTQNFLSAPLPLIDAIEELIAEFRPPPEGRNTGQNVNNDEAAAGTLLDTISESSGDSIATRLPDDEPVLAPDTRIFGGMTSPNSNTTNGGSQRTEVHRVGDDVLIYDSVTARTFAYDHRRGIVEDLNADAEAEEAALLYNREGTRRRATGRVRAGHRPGRPLVGRTLTSGSSAPQATGSHLQSLSTQQQPRLFGEGSSRGIQGFTFTGVGGPADHGSGSLFGSFERPRGSADTPQATGFQPPSIFSPQQPQHFSQYSPSLFSQRNPQGSTLFGGMANPDSGSLFGNFGRPEGDTGPPQPTGPQTQGIFTQLQPQTFGQEDSQEGTANRDPRRLFSSLEQLVGNLSAQRWVGTQMHTNAPQQQPQPVSQGDTQDHTHSQGSANCQTASTESISFRVGTFVEIDVDRLQSNRATDFITSVRERRADGTFRQLPQVEGHRRLREMLNSNGGQNEEEAFEENGNGHGDGAEQHDGDTRE